MRGYLNLDEIERILEGYFDSEELEAVMGEVRTEADTCLCAARCYSDCCCGAWEEDDG